MTRDGVEPPTPAFSGLFLPALSVDSVRLSSQHLPEVALFIGARLEPKL